MAEIIPAFLAVPVTIAVFRCPRDKVATVVTMFALMMIALRL
jgi:mannose/fructose/N-acetylgalactosamine-specific phosphotransferase system component IID